MNIVRLEAATIVHRARGVDLIGAQRVSPRSRRSRQVQLVAKTASACAHATPLAADHQWLRRAILAATSIATSSQIAAAQQSP
jgi:hypothetical protein